MTHKSKKNVRALHDDELNAASGGAGAAGVDPNTSKLNKIMSDNAHVGNAVTTAVLYAYLYGA